MKFNIFHSCCFLGIVEKLIYELEDPESYTLKDLIEHIESNGESAAIYIVKDGYVDNDYNCGIFSNGVLTLRSKVLNPIMEENPKLFRVRRIVSGIFRMEVTYHITIPYIIVHRYL